MVIPIPARKASQGLPNTTGGDHRWWKMGLKMQSDANTEMKSRVNCFSAFESRYHLSNDTKWSDMPR